MKAGKATAAAFALAVVVLALSFGLLLRPPSSPKAVVEEEYIHPELVNGICYVYPTTSTNTLFVTIGNGAQAPMTTTTETVTLSDDGIIYMNVTMVGSGQTCTEINPGYGVKQSPPCGPCV